MDHDGQITQAELQAMLEAVSQLPEIDRSQPPKMIIPPTAEENSSLSIMARCGLEPGSQISRVTFVDMV